MTTGDNKTHRYTEKTVKAILAAVQSGKSVKEILAARDMPDEPTFSRWLTQKKGLAERMDAARAEALINDIIRIADEAEPETLKLSELKIKTRQWLAEKLNPKKFGKSGGSAETDEPLVSVIRPAAVTKPDESGK